MARIAGVDLPREKRVEIGLTYVYGIGRVSADRILEAANVDPSTRVRDLTDDEVKRISAVIDETMTVKPISTRFSLGKSTPAIRAMCVYTSIIFSYLL